MALHWGRRILLSRLAKIFKVTVSVDGISYGAKPMSESPLDVEPNAFSSRNSSAIEPIAVRHEVVPASGPNNLNLEKSD